MRVAQKELMMAPHLVALSVDKTVDWKGVHLADYLAGKRAVMRVV